MNEAITHKNGLVYTNSTFQLVVNKSDIFFKNPYSPNEDKETSGKVVTTIVRGMKVYDQNRELEVQMSGKEVSFN